MNTDSTETKQTKRNTDCGCRSVAAFVPEDVVGKDLVTEGTKDSLPKDPVNHVATQEVAQVTKGRSGGSAKVKAKRRELQMKSAETCCSRFLMIVGCFILEAVVFFSMFLMIMSPIQSKQTQTLKQTLKQTMKRQTVCEFCQDDHGTSGHVDWEYHGGRTGSGQSDRECRCDWTFVDPCFRMLRGFPQVEDLTQDQVVGDSPQGDEVSEVGSPSLANTEDFEGWGPHELGLFARTPRHTRLSRGIRSGVQCP